MQGARDCSCRPCRCRLAWHLLARQLDVLPAASWTMQAGTGRSPQPARCRAQAAAGAQVDVAPLAALAGFDVTFTLPAPGLYSLEVDLGGSALGVPAMLAALPRVLQAPQWRLSGARLAGSRLAGKACSVGLRV